jgi:hypothetical protein
MAEALLPASTQRYRRSVASVFEVCIHSYFSVETDLAAEMSSWPEFVSGSGYTVELATPDGTESVSVTRSEANSDDLPCVRISGSAAGTLFDRVLGRVIFSLAAHSDTLVVKRTGTTARFRVSRILKLSSREGIYLCGDAVDGTIRVGMNVLWPLHGDAVTMPACVRAIECLDVDRSAGKAEVALAIRFDEDAAGMEQLFRDLLEPGMVVDVKSEGATE